MGNYLRPGDIIVFQTGGWAAKVIQRAQWIYNHSDTYYRWNHAAIYEGGGYIIEAEPKGVQRTSLLTNYTHTKYKVIKLPYANDHARRKAVMEARSWIGAPYGWYDILAFSLAVIGFKPRWVRNRLKDVRTIVCSQLVAKAAEAGGVNRWGDWFYATPSMVARDYDKDFRQSN